MMSATNAVYPNEQGYIANTSVLSLVSTSSPASLFCGAAFYSSSIYAPQPPASTQAPGFIVAGFRDGQLYLLQNTTWAVWDNGSVFANNFQPIGGFFRFTQFGNDILATSYMAASGPAVWSILGSTQFVPGWLTAPRRDHQLGLEQLRIYRQLERDDWASPQRASITTGFLRLRRSLRTADCS